MYAIQRPDGSYVQIGDWYAYEDIEDLYITHHRRAVIERILEERTNMVGGTEGHEVVRVEPGSKWGET